MTASGDVRFELRVDAKMSMPLACGGAICVTSNNYTVKRETLCITSFAGYATCYDPKTPR